MSSAKDATDFEVYSDLAVGEARRVHRQLRGVVDLDELTAIANVGLVEALQRVDPQRTLGERRAFVRLRVRGRILDSVGNVFNLPRRAWRLRRKGTLHASRYRGDISELDLERLCSHSPERERIAMADAIDGCRARRALRLLPDRSAELLFRVYVEGRSLVDAAKVMGLSPSWASRLRREALQSIRSQLEPSATTSDGIEPLTAASSNKNLK